MSEYQYVVFQAVDGPLNDKQLAFAHQQSSRAEVSRWSLSVEYEYSYFGGDVDGLLRHGYDVYLQFTNYGTREIKLRLPAGMPFTEIIWSKYVDGEQLQYDADARAPGGILTLCPCRENDDYEQLYESQKYLDAAVYVRQRLLSGDLRALYALWLCASEDSYTDPSETIEPPVPHGIAESADGFGDLLSFFGLDPLLLVAAGDDLPGMPNAASENQPVFDWLESIAGEEAKQVLQQMLVGDTMSEKARVLAMIRDSPSPVAWPTSERQRSFQELLARADILRDKESAKHARAAKAQAKRAAEKAQRERAKRLTEMRQDPERWLGEADRLIENRGTYNYKAAAEILHDVREAVGGEEGEQIARLHAAKLAASHPTLNHLKSSLRKQGLL